MTEAFDKLRAALAGRYDVEREIGAGGMATVYLAHDTRHGRRVAAKVLRPELAAAVGAERFLREIKVTAALQHPHILALFDSGAVAPDEAGGPGPVYYVMPYVEGESLRARLDRVKQLPVRDALDIARAVASALDYAHRRGIVHRDIKPENILLVGGERDGLSGMQALVADFGVAVAVESVGTGRLTESGLSVGTPTYMSPEQASAERNLGPTSDIYALGVVLYEMLTGEPPFTGPTAQAVVARVMTDTPAPLRLRRATVPARVEAAVMRALAKSPADRPASAVQFADELQSDEFPVVSTSPATSAASRGVSRFLPWALVGALAIVSGVLFARGRSADGRATAGAPGVGATHFAIAMPESTTAVDWLHGVAASPDGRLIAFVAANQQGRNQIYLKRLDEPTINPLAGTVDGENPFFSPDARSLGFFASGKLKTVVISSGTVTVIADTVEGAIAQWADDGCILYNRGGIQCVTETGVRKALTRPDTTRGERMHFAPQLIPGSRTLMYTVLERESVRYRVMIRRDDATPARVLIDGASVARYLGDGRLMYQKGAELFVANIDLKALAVSGDRRVLSGVAPMTRTWFGAPWAVANNMLVYGSAAGLARGLAWVDRTGGRRPLPVPPRSFAGLAVSPDGRRVLTSTTDGGRWDIWIYDLVQDVLTQVTHNGQSIAALWGPTAGALTVVESGKTLSIVTRKDDGTGTPEPLVTTGSFLYPAAWTRDGRSLVLMDAADISVIDRANPTLRRPLVKTPFDEYGGRLSPDDRWLAYFSNISGPFELYLTRFPDGGPGTRVSRTGAREAVWSRDGKELFFRSENGRQFLSVSIGAGPALVAGTPVVMFEGDYFFMGGPGFVNFDVSPDGKRFLILERPGTESTRGYLNVVLGWDRLQR